MPNFGRTCAYIRDDTCHIRECTCHTRDCTCHIRYDATERNQLLNFILEEKSNTMQACPPKHPAYTKFNNLMRGAMASMSVMRAVNEG
eukprot:3797209-Prymnesium_polylepis.1